MAAKPRVVSGMRPTGRLHLGNYWGALKNWIELQDKYDCMFFVADWHALTTGHEDTASIADNSRQMVADWLAAGLDPEKCVIFRQSAVPEHAELCLLLGMITPLGWLLRNPTYKEQLVELYQKRYAGQENRAAADAGKTMQTLAGTLDMTDQKEIAALSEFSSLGFLGYPVLMATDIVIHGGQLVPVGQDQLPHLEITRDIVRRFSDLYGKDILREPKPLLTSAPKIPGLDGRKMSKSYGNAIELGEAPDSACKKIMRMYTDPKKVKANDKGNPEGCVVFSFHKVYNPQCAERERECREGVVGCVACKKQLCALVSPALEVFCQKRGVYDADLSAVDAILARGSERARASAAVTLAVVKQAMGLKV